MIPKFITLGTGVNAVILSVEHILSINIIKAPGTDIHRNQYYVVRITSVKETFDTPALLLDSALSQFKVLNSCLNSVYP